MKVTVAQGKNVAVFTWDDSAEQCEYGALGFTDAQVDEIIESKAHMGQQVTGYEVEVEL